MPEFSRLLLFHALRPDRLTAAMAKFVSNSMGAKWALCQVVGVGDRPWEVITSFYNLLQARST